MKLKKLFSGIEVKSWRGSKEIEISGLCNDSRRMAPGNLFIAKKGLHTSGVEFVLEAVSNGASAILTDLYNPFIDKKIVQILHDDVASIEPLLSKRYYSFPDQELLLIGVTGTSGKTTTTYLIHHLLEKWGIACGMIGTVEIITSQNRYPSAMTTFDCLTNHKILREMVLAGCKACVLEVSSQGLAQGRVEGIDFDIALFTNLTHEHLDYHKTMEDYFSAKRKLFTSLAPSKNGKETFAIFNADSPYAERMKEGSHAKIVTYGMEKPSDLMAKDICFSLQRTKTTLTSKEQQETFSLPLIGRYNVYNLCAAVSVGLCLGIPLAKMKEIFSSFPEVPGRLQRVVQKQPFSVFVDYAHKEDALREVLKTLREVTKGKILTLFGCGGDRDREKRPRMAKVAEEFSDFVVVTSDNPRSEDPQKIIHEILVGFSSNRYLVEPDRRKAMEAILKMAQKDDLVLIAGKGHETVQISAGKRQDFDDRKIAREICDALFC